MCGNQRCRHQRGGQNVRKAHLEVYRRNTVDDLFYGYQGVSEIQRRLFQKANVGINYDQ
jgi:hypothetical protein